MIRQLLRHLPVVCFLFLSSFVYANDFSSFLEKLGPFTKGKEAVLSLSKVGDTGLRLRVFTSADKKILKSEYIISRSDEALTSTISHLLSSEKTHFESHEQEIKEKDLSLRKPRIVGQLVLKPFRKVS